MSHLRITISVTRNKEDLIVLTVGEYPFGIATPLFSCLQRILTVPKTTWCAHKKWILQYSKTGMITVFGWEILYSWFTELVLTLWRLRSKRRGRFNLFASVCLKFALAYLGKIKFHDYLFINCPIELQNY